MTLDTIATALGYGIMTAGGALLTAGLLHLAALLAGRSAWKLFDHLKSIYKLQTIQYYFKKLDGKGYSFLKEKDEP